jgi:pimeloyl-ACP methyl ester carboxylesterase
VAEIRARAGVRQVALVGVRFGAALAFLAAKDDDAIDGLVAWAPVVSGRTYVRELRALKMVKATKTTNVRRTDGGEEVEGYVFSRDTLTDLNAVDLAAAGADHVTKRVLVLPRDDSPGQEGGFVAHLKQRDVDVKVASESGYARMMRDPFDSVVPSVTLDAIVDWLGAWAPSEDASRGITQGAAPSHAASMAISYGSKTELTETPLFFGDRERLFGIVTDPIVEVPSERPAVCFLNVGSNHHIGPHRMYVDLAREIASLGYRTFRFDVGGLGESPAITEAGENRLYSDEQVADVKSAMTFLEKLRGTRRFVLVGLCSGAYLAFRAAVEDSRVCGQVLLSPHAFEWKEGDSVEPVTREKAAKVYGSNRYYVRALLDRSVWRRALQGRVDLRGIAAIVLKRASGKARVGMVSLGARLRGRPEPRNDVERAFGALCDRGVESLIALSSADGGLDMIGRYLGDEAAKVKGRKNFSLEILEGTDHTFTPEGAQRVLRELVTSFVTLRCP